jgi:hypothetical protein
MNIPEFLRQQMGFRVPAPQRDDFRFPARLDGSRDCLWMHGHHRSGT